MQDYSAMSFYVSEVSGGDLEFKCEWYSALSLRVVVVVVGALKKLSHLFTSVLGIFRSTLYGGNLHGALATRRSRIKKSRCYTIYPIIDAFQYI